MRYCLSLLAIILFTACSSASHPSSSPEDNPKEQESQPKTNITGKLKITVGSKSATASFEQNSSSEAFVAKLKANPVTVNMTDYGNFEKVGSLGFTLPRNDKPITTSAGDIILYNGSQITIYYDNNSYSLTKLAHMDNMTKAQVKEFLGEGNVTVTFSYLNQ